MKLKVGREKYNREAAKLKWLERLEKLQEKVVMRKKAITARAREKNDIELIKRAEKAEADAIATLERIRADKKRIEQELENINSEQEEPSSTLTLTVGESEEEEEENYLEKYPVNEPYAYVVITATSPPLYKVKEVKLTRGEAELLKELKTRLYETLDVSLKDVKDAEEILKKKVRELIEEFSLGDALSNESLDKIMYYLKRDLVGFGKLDPLMHDKMAEDISADGPGIPLFVYHRVYGSIETNIIFDKEELDALIYKLAQRSGRHISLAKPLLDAALPNQDRLQLSMGSEVTARGSTFTIRKFRSVPITPIDLVNYGTFSLEMMAYLWMAVDNGSNILIAGGTASGKTTVLNAIAMFIPPESKIVSIEDTREINLLHKNWIPAVTREVEEGAHGIEMFDLLRSALRQRPEYVLVGEVRGREAHTLFQAMATGHITMSTFHADSAETVVKRLTKQPINVPLMLLDSLDIIPIQKMTKVGNKLARRCTKIVEVTGVDFENETLKTNDLFMWHPDEFEFSGESEVFVKIMDKLNMSEMELGEEFARRRRVLEGLQQRGMSDFQSLNKVLHDYSIDPEATEKKIWVER
ncbi:MAG: type II/IV secretion system ATPase subunit [Methanophagales archaeon]|nr:type II/IV secretion system ATPase subunit [Methanophagales archaeon]